MTIPWEAVGHWPVRGCVAGGAVLLVGRLVVRWPGSRPGGRGSGRRRSWPPCWPSRCPESGLVARVTGPGSERRARAPHRVAKGRPREPQCPDVRLADARSRPFSWCAVRPGRAPASHGELGPPVMGPEPNGRRWRQAGIGQAPSAAATAPAWHCPLSDDGLARARGLGLCLIAGGFLVRLTWATRPGPAVAKAQAAPGGRRRSSAGWPSPGLPAGRTAGLGPPGRPCLLRGRPPAEC